MAERCPKGHPLEPGGWCYACLEREAIQAEAKPPSPP